MTMTLTEAKVAVIRRGLGRWSHVSYPAKEVTFGHPLWRPAEINRLSFQPVGSAHWAHSQRSPAPANARFLVYPAVYQHLVYALTTALTCQR